MHRAEALRALSREHNFALLLARRARRAVASEDDERIGRCWDELVQAYTETLEAHFEVEERVLLPLLRGCGAPDLAARLLREHRAIRRSLSDPARGDAQRLDAVATVLEAHVRREEREAFQLVQDCVGEEQLAELFDTATPRPEREGVRHAEP